MATPTPSGLFSAASTNSSQGHYFRAQELGTPLLSVGDSFLHSNPLALDSPFNTMTPATRDCRLSATPDSSPLGRRYGPYDFGTPLPSIDELFLHSELPDLDTPSDFTTLRDRCVSAGPESLSNPSWAACQPETYPHPLVFNANESAHGDSGHRLLVRREYLPSSCISS